MRQWGLEQCMSAEDGSSEFILPEIKDSCPMRPQMEMAWGRLELGNNERDPEHKFNPIFTPRYEKWMAEQCALKPAYDKVKVLEIKLRRIKVALKQSQEAGDKVNKSKCQLMNKCCELHDDTRRVLNKYSMEPMASNAHRFEEHLSDLLESLREMIR
ncbi:hypothetical protein ACH5RR_040732 [Cinchona calisaya]|uniref:Uncharacterized protein n=1 Tax=Cinchona calisaya TaxID=153742 RepID=A0ABD2XVL5_9GENT